MNSIEPAVCEIIKRLREAKIVGTGTDAQAEKIIRDVLGTMLLSAVSRPAPGGSAPPTRLHGPYTPTIDPRRAH